MDEALFGLGDRYGRLIELLIRLRRPQFSRKLEEEELSQTLSDALAVLPSRLIEVVAEAFRSLQADRDALRGFADMRSAAAYFLREYGLYARVAVRRRAAAVRSAHSAYEEAQRHSREAERRLAEAGETLDRIAERRAGLDQELASAEEAAKRCDRAPRCGPPTRLLRRERARKRQPARGTTRRRKRRWPGIRGRSPNPADGHGKAGRGGREGGDGSSARRTSGPRGGLGRAPPCATLRSDPRLAGRF